MEELKLLLDYLVVPLLIWIWSTDRKVAIHEFKYKMLVDANNKNDETIKGIFESINLLRSDLHLKSNK